MAELATISGDLNPPPVAPPFTDDSEFTIAANPGIPQDFEDDVGVDIQEEQTDNSIAMISRATYHPTIASSRLEG